MIHGVRKKKKTINRNFLHKFLELFTLIFAVFLKYWIIFWGWSETILWVVQRGNISGGGDHRHLKHDKEPQLDVPLFRSHHKQQQQKKLGTTSLLSYFYSNCFLCKVLILKATYNYSCQINVVDIKVQYLRLTSNQSNQSMQLSTARSVDYPITVTLFLDRVIAVKKLLLVECWKELES